MSTPIPPSLLDALEARLDAVEARADLQALLDDDDVAELLAGARAVVRAARGADIQGHAPPAHGVPAHGGVAFDPIGGGRG